MEKNRVILGSLRYKFSSDVDFGIKAPLLQTSKEMPEYDRTVNVNLAQLFDDERQESTTFRPSCKFTFLMENSLIGTCKPINPYTPFNNNLYYVNEQTSAKNQCGNGGVIVAWSGYPQFNEFDFIRTDSSVSGYTTPGNSITDYHVKFAPQSASTYNWMFYLTYPYDNDYTLSMEAVDNEYNKFNWICADGIPFIIENTIGAGQRLITFKCPMKHGLSVGEYVKLNFSYNGFDTFPVYSVGNGFYDSEFYIFSIYNVGYTGLTFANGTKGTFRRIINPTISAETLSKYYVRKHKILNNPQESVITKSGFELNGFKLQRKYFAPAYTPNFVERVSTKEGCQSYSLSFNGDFDINGLIDNQKRPVTQLFFSVIWRGYFGWTMRTSPSGNPANGEPLLEGWEFNLQPQQNGKPSDWWSKTNFDSRTNITTNYYTTPLGGATNKFTYNEFLNSGDTINGDFCEWNEYELTERVISTYYHKIKFNPTLFVVGKNTSLNTPGYYYQPHYPVQIRVFSEYIESGVKSEVENIPQYSVFSNSQQNFRWRDLYPYGYIDTAEHGVNYPFTNGKHYPFEDFVFRLIPEGSNYVNNNLTTDPIIDECE